MRITASYRQKKLVLSLLILSLVFAKPAFAETQTCVQVYGGGVVCGAATPPHKPVSTGLGENLAVIGAGFLLASGVLLCAKKRVLKA